MDKKTINIIVSVFTFLGITCIVSGAVMPSFAPPIENVVKVTVEQKRVSGALTNEIKPKDIEVEINNPLSVDIRDYLENVDQIDKSIIKKLKLDTSLVNIHQAGSYTYTITHEKKKFTGTVTIKVKGQPSFEIILKDLSFIRGNALPTDLSAYITGDIPEEIKALIRLDVTSVNINIPSVYQYSVISDGKMYTATITIYDQQPRISIPTTPPEEDSDSEIEIN